MLQYPTTVSQMRSFLAFVKIILRFARFKFVFSVYNILSPYLEKKKQNNQK